MTTITPDEQIVAPPDTAQAVIAAARDLARRYQLTPRWAERLTPQAVALVEAVHAHDRAAAAVTCVSCGAEWPGHYPDCEFIRPVRDELRTGAAS
jgi:hypothetical protein